MGRPSSSSPPPLLPHWRHLETPSPLNLLITFLPQGWYLRFRSCTTRPLLKIPDRPLTFPKSRHSSIFYIWMRQKAQAPYTDPPAGHIAISGRPIVLCDDGKQSPPRTFPVRPPPPPASGHPSQVSRRRRHTRRLRLRRLSDSQGKGTESQEKKEVSRQQRRCVGSHCSCPCSCSTCC